MCLETNGESVLKQGMMEHQSQVLFLEMNVETSAKEHTHNREPSAEPQDKNINLIRFRLVKKKKNAMNFRERSHSNTKHELRQHQVCISNTEALYI